MNWEMSMNEQMDYLVDDWYNLGKKSSIWGVLLMLHYLLFQLPCTVAVLNSLFQLKLA